jgi:hypothetical protein
MKTKLCGGVRREREREKNPSTGSGGTSLVGCPVCKSLKIKRGECGKLETRTSEQRGEEDREGVLNWRGLAVRREWRGIIMRAVGQGRGHKDSPGVAGSVGRQGTASSKERTEIRVEPFDRLRVDILRRMSKALAIHRESIAKVNYIEK